MDKNQEPVPYQKLLGLLGIARRAGKVSLGFDASQESMLKGKSKLLITACDLSERTFSSIEKTALQTKTKVIVINAEMRELGKAVGKLSGIVSVNDEGFSKRMIQLYEEESK